MEPIELDDEQTLFLPPHVSVTFGKDQPEYIPLPAVVLEGRERRVITRWSLSDKDRAAIAAGEDVYITVLTFGDTLQPIRPTVGLTDYCPADRM